MSTQRCVRASSSRNVDAERVKCILAKCSVGIVRVARACAVNVVVLARSGGCIGEFAVSMETGNFWIGTAFLPLRGPQPLLPVNVPLSRQTCAHCRSAAMAVGSAI